MKIVFIMSTGNIVPVLKPKIGLLSGRPIFDLWDIISLINGCLQKLFQDSTVIVWIRLIFQIF
jgi:hypothetical protein